MKTVDPGPARQSVATIAPAARGAAGAAEQRHRSRRARGLLAAIALVHSGLLLAACGSQPENPITRENALPGSPRAEWGLEPTDTPGIEGYATEFSVTPGDTVRFKVRTDSSDYVLHIYRMGYYGGDGARRVASVSPSRYGTQPPCAFQRVKRRVDCSGWFESASWEVPAAATSGIYFAKLLRQDPLAEGANHVFFVVREGEPRSALLFQTSDTTWQAYNRYGDVPERGYSLYGGPPGHNRPAVAVSYDRPFGIGALRATRQQHFVDGRHGVFASEYPMVRFLERNGYDVSYWSGADTARFGDALKHHEVFLSVGHDEYWGPAQRTHIERARNHGLHLAFFGGNAVYWRVRWQDDYRTLVCYRGPRGAMPAGMGKWREAAKGSPAQPENALTGTLSFRVSLMPMRVPAALGRHRFWRNTRFAELEPGGEGVTTDHIVGYEWDEDIDNGHRPPGLMRVAETHARSGKDHRATLYRHPRSGALVFSAGTVQWSWGLDGPDPAHRFVPDAEADAPPDRALQQATVNLLADMGVQPATLQPGLTRATASTDEGRPQLALEQLDEGVAGGEVMIQGTASDAEGVVAAVEVAIDGRWHPAEGREGWQYAWTPEEPGRFDIAARAVDDSGNLSPIARASIEVRGAEGSP